MGKSLQTPKRIQLELASTALTGAHWRSLLPTFCETLKTRTCEVVLNLKKALQKGVTNYIINLLAVLGKFYGKGIVSFEGLSSNPFIWLNSAILQSNLGIMIDFK